MAQRLLLLLAVAAASLLAADARPCHTFFVSFPAEPNPIGDGAVHHHRLVPRVATVVAVFRVRRLGPPDPPPRAPAPPRPSPEPWRPGAQDRARDILVVVVGLLFGVACGALTAASLYLVWSGLAGPAASSPYDELYGEEDDEEASDTESPKKVGYVIIQELEVHDGGKN
ncbi:hypothetical protein PR202_gb08327 [Eleusine coracana subsp. coracana]|uniref:Uncharacterized protein n=1 Tax=Eleusine coracana subsp. coracana TaxID=191504 RepID=A0AAV5EBV1_ELECO|nr:hypothetical protein PR202_gb08327 [Eleusine coracana subsp. coracana]